MPRYFFHVADGVDSIRDETGTEFDTFGAARAEAVVFLGELLKSSPAKFWCEGTWTVTVEDEAGQVVVSVCLTGMPASAQIHPFRPR